MSTQIERRQSALSLDADAFRTLGHQLVEQIADRLAAVPDGPITRNSSPAAIRAALDLTAPLPERGTAPDRILESVTRLLFEHSLFNAHPRFFGYITGAPAPLGMLGDFLASALNANVGSWTLGPAATEVEAQTVRWIAELIGFPAGDGLLVSGGNAANISCMVAARCAAASWDVRSEGVGGPGRQLVAYASAETHTWIQKAADICGIGTSAIRWIRTDDALQMDIAALEQAIDDDLAAGRIPFLVVGTAGTVSTGAIDPLPQIAALCRRRRIWFHVDGAYGGFAAALADAPAALLGLRDADSVAVDPHKWLYAPLEAGCVLVRSGRALRDAFSYHPPYYHFDEQVLNYVDHGPQNSRGFRALKVWLALKQVGASGYRAMIADDIALSRAMADAVAAHPELELLTQSLSITTFRYVPAGLRARLADPEVDAYIDTLNRTLLETLQREGELFVSNAVVRGRFALRACIVNFNTALDDVQAVPEIVVGRGRLIDSHARTEPIGWIAE